MACDIKIAQAMPRSGSEVTMAYLQDGWNTTPDAEVRSAKAKELIFTGKMITADRHIR